MKLPILALAVAAAAAAAAAAAPRGDPVRGERAYQKCYSCHAIEPGEEYSGPSLHNLVGRRIASEPGFAYSPALRALAAREKRWTPALLDRFMADPDKVAPRSTMTFFGIRNPQERADVLAFIASRQKRR
jgi:cytochrome c